MDQNACAECGFTTADLGEFTRHVERHENGQQQHQQKQQNGGGPTAGKKLKEELKRHRKCRRQSPPSTSPTSVLLHHDQQQQMEEQQNGEDQKEELDLLEDQENSSSEEGIITAAEGAENSAEMLGHLADLSRFLATTSPNEENEEEEEDNLELEEEEEEEEEMGGEGGDQMDAKKDEMSPDFGEEDGTDGQKRKGEKRHQNSGSGGGTTSTWRRSKGGGGKTTHKCPHCTFTTYMSQHMKSHLRAHDNFVGQMYICDVCGMAFSQKANMHRHRGTHSGVKPYECRFCQKRFFRKDQMQEHSMTHIKTGDDFDCPVSGCEQKFSQHTLLRQHLDHKHNIASTQQAQCKRCSLQFSNSRRLLLHYQTKHDEYYTSVSPVPEGQSPIKRLNSHQKQRNYEELMGGTINKPRRTRKRARNHNNNNKNAVLDGEAKPSQNRNNKAQKESSLGSAVGGYNVEELLKLDCATDGVGRSSSISASVSPAATSIFEHQQNQNAAAASTVPMFHPSASSASSPMATPAGGLDLFRDHLFRTCSSAALFAQFGGTPPPPNASAPTIPPFMAAAGKDHHLSSSSSAAAAAMASAAAAQLFMQSLHAATFIQQQQQQQHSASLSSSPLASNGPKRRGGTSPIGSRTMPMMASGPKHLPVTKSPDCRGLVLNGFKSDNAIGCHQPPPAKMIKIEGVSQKGDEEEEETTAGEASESEDPLPASTNTLSVPMLPSAIAAGKRRRKSPSLHKTNSRTSAATENGIKNQEHQHLAEGNCASSACITASTPSGHSSTSHSPSSSSTASSTTTTIGGDIGGGGGGGGGGGRGSATSSSNNNDSPLKVLNGLTSSSSAGLLSRALMASEGLLKEALDQPVGEMDCTHCGLLFSDQTLYLLHKGLHAEADPWRCNLCGVPCKDKYTFTTHIVSSDHSHA